jgi:hypothetical protein
MNREYNGPEKRSKQRRKTLGRRDEDVRDVCIWHDLCHESMSRIKQDQIDHTNWHKERDEKMEKKVDSKLPRWIFALFMSTAIPVGLLFLGWIGWNAFETVRIVTRLDTNQRHLMKDFGIKPVEMPEESTANDKNKPD